MKRDITLDPYAIEKTPLYSTTVHFDGNRLEFFTEWRKRFLNTEIVILDLVDSGEWYVAWINHAYDTKWKAQPNEGLE